MLTLVNAKFDLILAVAAASCFSFAAGADWPQFLGPNRNGTAAPLSPNSLRNPKLLWKKQVGAGFSAPVVANAKVILFHRVDNKETVECLNSTNGDRVWVFEYPTSYRDDFGFDEGPRADPRRLDGRVYTFGAEGVLHALDLNTGKKLWRVDTHPKFGIVKGSLGQRPLRWSTVRPYTLT